MATQHNHTRTRKTAAKPEPASPPTMLTHKDTSETALAFLKDRLVRATDVTSEAVAALDAVV